MNKTPWYYLLDISLGLKPARSLLKRLEKNFLMLIHTFNMFLGLQRSNEQNKKVHSFSQQTVFWKHLKKIGLINFAIKLINTNKGRLTF